MRLPRSQRTLGAACVSIVTTEQRKKGMPAAEWHRELFIATLFRTSIKLQNHMDRRFQPLGTTAQEAAVLLRIVEARRTTPGALAHSLARDKAKVSRFIQRLVARNLIRRKVKAQDRRVGELEPTREGRAFALRVKSVFVEFREDVFQGIPEQQVKQVGDVLLALMANMDAGNCGEPEGGQRIAAREESTESVRGMETDCNLVG